MRQRRVYIRVSFVLPEGATLEACREYVEDAVASMKGSYHPEDPIFELDGETVEATVLRSRPR